MCWSSLEPSLELAQGLLLWSRCSHGVPAWGGVNGKERCLKEWVPEISGSANRVLVSCECRVYGPPISHKLPRKTLTFQVVVHHVLLFPVPFVIYALLWLHDHLAKPRSLIKRAPLAKWAIQRFKQNNYWLQAEHGPSICVCTYIWEASFCQNSVHVRKMILHFKIGMYGGWIHGRLSLLTIPQFVVPGTIKTSAAEQRRWSIGFLQGWRTVPFLLLWRRRRWASLRKHVEELEDGR